ncbi:MAG: cell division protein ZapA [Clostridiales Family XIII bacterium]|jgi:cell division protein ZapA|nr:cell division protein ZapA [Clostridiales Family XIII bacterium]
MSEVENTRVTVRIFGQEYTVASAEPRERVLQIANHVDEVMRGLTEKGAGGSVSALAMLAAVNIAGELFAERDEQSVGAREKTQLEKDISHYQQLWEEAKKTHVQAKEDAKAIQEQKDALQEKLNAKNLEVENLIRKAEERDKVVARLESELDQAKSQAQNATSERADSKEKIQELQAKLKEVEGNFFELQMDNIRMKGDLERYRGGL